MLGQERIWTILTLDHIRLPRIHKRLGPGSISKYQTPWTLQVLCSKIMNVCISYTHPLSNTKSA